MPAAWPNPTARAHTSSPSGLGRAGTQAIVMPLRLIGGSKNAVVIDPSGVEFTASMGLRSRVVCAKPMFNKGGKAVLLHDEPAAGATGWRCASPCDRRMSASRRPGPPDGMASDGRHTT